MLKITRTAALSLALVAAAQGAQLRTRAAAEARLAVGDQALIQTLAAKYNCADASKSLSQHLEDIRTHAESQLHDKTETCAAQATAITEGQAAVAETKTNLLNGDDCVQVEGYWPEDGLEASCDSRKNDAIAAADGTKVLQETAYNKRKADALKAMKDAKGPKDTAQTALGLASAAMEAAQEEERGLDEGLRKQLQNALLASEGAHQAAVEGLGRALVATKAGHKHAKDAAVTACNTAHNQVIALHGGEREQIDEIETLVGQLKACGDDSDMPSSLLEVAAKTQDKTQSKCALARAKLNRRLAARSKTTTNFLDVPETQYSADGSVASWRQAVEEEGKNAEEEWQQCKRRAQASMEAANTQAQTQHGEAVAAAGTTKTTADSTARSNYEPQIAAIVKQAADAAAAYDTANEAFHAIDGPLAKYTNAVAVFYEVRDEMQGGKPVLEFFQSQFDEAKTAAEEQRSSDFAEFSKAVEADAGAKDQALETQGAEEQRQCDTIKAEINTELGKVADIVAKVGALTGAPQAPQWSVGDKGKSCTNVCEGKHQHCVQEALDDLNGNNNEYVIAKYALAGHTCTNFKRDCEGDNNCVRWGSPYIHSSHFAEGQCWGGDQPSVAPCGQTPSDHHHQRLCPCI